MARFVNCYSFFKLGILSLFWPDIVARSLIKGSLEILRQGMDENEPWADEIMKRVVEIRTEQETKMLQRMWQRKLKGES